MKQLVILVWLIILALVWLLWSGLYKPLVLGLGALSCVLTVYFCHRIDFFEEPSGLHVIPRIPIYLFKLFVDIIKSNIDVTRIILNPKLPISPTEVTIKAQPKGPIGQVILGNAITLSPGTVTIDIFEDQLHVHCLTQAGADEMIEGEINKRTAELTEK